ncbi:hypothetical protein EWH99_10005 [Sporolactobacillus sp. THM7-7]|nr:hypothetical protein EWH99_10005 [Sporolactobacillus sp. THM7-7]
MSVLRKIVVWTTPLVLLLAACGGHSGSPRDTEGTGSMSHEDHSAGTAGSSMSASSTGNHGDAKVSTLHFNDDGTIPNNQKFSVLVYHGAFKGLNAEQIADRFLNNNWGNNWVDGVFDFHHFHSTSHEVLGIAGGSGEIQLGGPKGKIIKVKAGDVLVLPAGTGHKRISASSDFSVVGGYPNGQDYDTQTKETAAIKANIAKVGKPDQDPVYGKKGPMLRLWKK